jgi:heterodisulfide reductase subunit C
MLLCRRFDIHEGGLEPQEKLEYCLQCAVCGQVCVVNFADIYDPQHTFVYDLFQAKIEARETLWGCPSCHKCEERCPYDFRPLELVKAHKEVAFAAGLAPEEIYREFESILTTGVAFPVSSVTQRQRAKLGLPELSKKPVHEIAIIAEHTGLKERLGSARKVRQSTHKVKT